MDLYIDIKKKLSGFLLNVQLQTNEKEIIGILGASGAGKSMLLRCISGLVKPDDGQIVVNGKTLFDSKQKVNLHPQDRRVGFLFQNYALFPHLTICENIAFGLGRFSKQKQEEKVQLLINKFHLNGLEKRYPSQISGGQQQRVALARAMAVEPEILLLDEPFSALDEHLRAHVLKEMMESLKDFKGTTLFVTHNIEEAFKMCDRLIIIKEGCVEAKGLKHTIFEKPPTLETAKITGCKNISTAIKKSNNTLYIPDWGIDVVTESTITKEEGYGAIRANHIRIDEERREKNTFSAYIADISEMPFRMTLYLKFGSTSMNSEDFHVQCSISKEKWEKIKNKPQPLDVVLPSSKVVFIKE